MIHYDTPSLSLVSWVSLESCSYHLLGQLYGSPRVVHLEHVFCVARSHVSDLYTPSFHVVPSQSLMHR